MIDKKAVSDWNYAARLRRTREVMTALGLVFAVLLTGGAAHADQTVPVMLSGSGTATNFTLTGCPACAQITSTDTQVIAQAGKFLCTLTPRGAICLAGGQPYIIWTPPLVPGADASLGSPAWNGNVVNASLWMRGTVVSWFVSVQPNGGIVTRQSGAFSFPPPVVTAGPVTVGTMVRGVCQPQATGFHPSSTAPILSGEKGAVLLANEPVGNCGYLPSVQ